MHLAPRVGNRTEVVLNGIELPAEPGPLPAPADVVRLGCVARIHPWKGQELLLRAVALLEQERQIGKRLEVHLYGSAFPGHEHLVDDLRTLARDLGLADRLQLHGFVRDPAQIYPRIDVLVLPSTDPEPFGLVCVEALSFGRPVIAPREGGPAEIIDSGRTGILFEPRSVRSLAEAIARVVAEPELSAELAFEGRCAAEERFAAKRYQGDIRNVVARESGQA